MRTQHPKDKNALNPLVFIHRGLNLIGFLICYLDWVEDFYTAVDEWGDSIQYFMPGRESLKFYVEGWLKFYAKNYIEIENSNFVALEKYRQESAYPFYGSKIQYLNVSEIILNDKDEPRLQDFIKLLLNENRIEFDSLIDKELINSNPIFQKCLAMALQYYENSLITNRHGYREVASRDKYLYG